MIDEPLRQKLATKVARLEQQISAFKELHATELGLILDELAALRAELAALTPAAPDADAAARPMSAPATPIDPAAASPKRAQWLADEARKEEQRNAPLSRREFLRGRDREES